MSDRSWLYRDIIWVVILSVLCVNPFSREGVYYLSVEDEGSMTD